MNNFIIMIFVNVVPSLVANNYLEPKVVGM